MKEKVNENLSKKERKEMDKLKKEKDRLEMQAMVLRIQERDKEQKDGKSKVADSVVESHLNVDVNDSQVQELIP